jgi:hypothetical protein
VIRKVREEFPPLASDPQFAKALSALAAERQRQGLSLSDVSARSGMDRATRSKRMPDLRYDGVTERQPGWVQGRLVQRIAGSGLTGKAYQL